MAEVKKATAKAVAKAEPVKEAAAEAKKEVKEAPEVKAEVKKAPAKRAAAKKPAAKKAPVKKAAAKKETAPKEAVKQEEVKETVNFQFSGKSYTPDALLSICRDVWKYDLNGKEEDFKSVELYVKPEENTTYYVINGDITGSFFI
ncbi:MAG: DUF6465 family protein [Lachnospiraceae bacterium]|nr:DUF6465 family protein [Lachnospiraceae bacterium]